MKKYVSFLLAVTLLLCLTACHSTQNPPVTAGSSTVPTTDTSLPHTVPESTVDIPETKPTNPAVLPVETMPTLSPGISPTEPQPTVKPTVPQVPVTIPTSNPTVLPSEPMPCHHAYITGTQQEAGCETAGFITYICSKCAHSYQEILSPTGHSFQDANCTSPKTCSACSAMEGKALGHRYSGGKCIRCGDAEPNCTITVYLRGSDSKNISGVTVTLSTTDGEKLGSGISDGSGCTSITLEEHPGTYRVTLSGIPAGYQGKASYTFSATRANITLNLIPVIDPNDHSKAQYSVGDVMGDFTITDTDGNSYTLSRLLKEKKLVILNFWFCNCGPCKAEFPHFDALYQQYGSQIELLAMNHIDSESSIKALKEDMGLSFPMLREDLGMSGGFGIKYYPTTVFIGSDGTILQIKIGSYSSEAELRSVIEKYLK